MSNLEKDKIDKAAESDIIYVEEKAPEPWIFRTPFYDRDLPFPEDDMDRLSDTVRIDSATVPSPLMRLKSTSSLSSNSESQNLSGRFSPAPSLDSTVKSEKASGLRVAHGPGLYFDSSESLTMVQGLFSSSSLADSIKKSPIGPMNSFHLDSQVVNAENFVDRENPNLENLSAGISSEQAYNNGKVGEIATAASVLYQDEDLYPMHQENTVSGDSQNVYMDVKGMEAFQGSRNAQILEKGGSKLSEEKVVDDKLTKNPHQNLSENTDLNIESMKNNERKINIHDKSGASTPSQSQTILKQSNQIHDPRSFSAPIDSSSVPVNTLAAGQDPSNSSNAAPIAALAAGAAIAVAANNGQKKVSDDQNTSLNEKQIEDDNPVDQSQPSFVKNSIDFFNSLGWGVSSVKDENIKTTDASGQLEGASNQNSSPERHQVDGLNYDIMSESSQTVQISEELRHGGSGPENLMAAHDYQDLEGNKIQEMSHGSSSDLGHVAEPQVHDALKLSKSEKAFTDQQDGPVNLVFEASDALISNYEGQLEAESTNVESEIIETDGADVQNESISIIPVVASAAALGLAMNDLGAEYTESVEEDDTVKQNSSIIKSSQNLRPDSASNSNGNYHGVSSNDMKRGENGFMDSISGYHQDDHHKSHISEQNQELAQNHDNSILAEGLIEKDLPVPVLHDINNTDNQMDNMKEIPDLITLNVASDGVEFTGSNADFRIGNEVKENEDDLESEFDERLRLLTARARNADDLLKQLAELIQEMNEDIVQLTSENNKQRREIRSLKKKD